MEDHPSIPEALSHRQLSRWLSAAAEAGSHPQTEAFKAQLQSWSQSSQQLLAMLQGAGPAVVEGRSTRELMALGALQAHLTMALQARAASGC
jgi:hypothetical protein